MTLQPTANRADVISENGIVGVHDTLANSIPNYLTEATTGNANISGPIEEGYVLQPGSTSGDEAWIGITHGQHAQRFSNAARLVYTFWFSDPNTSVTDAANYDDFVLGPRNEANGDGVGFNYRTGDLKVGSSSQQLTSGTPQGTGKRAFVLRLDIRFKGKNNAGTIYATLEGANGRDELVYDDWLNDTNINIDARMASAVSRGNDTDHPIVAFSAFAGLEGVA